MINGVIADWNDRHLYHLDWPLLFFLSWADAFAWTALHNDRFVSKFSFKFPSIKLCLKHSKLLSSQLSQSRFLTLFWENYCELLHWSTLALSFLFERKFSNLGSIKEDSLSIYLLKNIFCGKTIEYSIISHYFWGYLCGGIYMGVFLGLYYWRVFWGVVWGYTVRVFLIESSLNVSSAQEKQVCSYCVQRPSPKYILFSHCILHFGSHLSF